MPANLIQKHIWRFTYGRSTEEDGTFAANGFKDAVALALQIIKAEKPDWKEIDENDIWSLEDTGDTMIVGVEETE